MPPAEMDGRRQPQNAFYPTAHEVPGYPAPAPVGVQELPG